jgi:hypothetical protein
LERICRELLALERCQSESASAGDDQVEHGPAVRKELTGE